jgi:Mce-associated membrane protein
MSGDNDPVADEPSPDDIAERDGLADETEAADEAELPDVDEAAARGRRGRSAGRTSAPGSPGLVCWLRSLPALALILALGVGYLKWLDGTARESRVAADQSVRAASDKHRRDLVVQAGNRRPGFEGRRRPAR